MTWPTPIRLDVQSSDDTLGASRRKLAPKAYSLEVVAALDNGNCMRRKTGASSSSRNLTKPAAAKI